MLQNRFDQIEDELHKKRAELREALCQDGAMVGMHQSRPTKVNGDGIHVGLRGSVTLEPMQGNYRHDDESDEMVTDRSYFHFHDSMKIFGTKSLIL